MITEISKASHDIEVIKALNESFLKRVKSNALQQDVTSRPEISEGEMAVPCLEYVAKAVPRIVKTNGTDFAVEYVFYVKQQDEQIEVCRFYLTNDGRITQSLAQPHITLFECQNYYIAQNIHTCVLHGALHSPLFRPIPEKE